MFAIVLSQKIFYFFLLFFGPFSPLCRLLPKHHFPFFLYTFHHHLNLTCGIDNVTRQPLNKWQESCPQVLFPLKSTYSHYFVIVPETSPLRNYYANHILRH